MAENVKVVYLSTQSVTRVLVRNGTGHKLFEMDIHGVTITITVPLDEAIKIVPDEGSHK
jgi:hypothetical protein